MKEMKPFIIVRGGGDLATGTIYMLHKAGYRVLVLESEQPSAIRRYVAVSEAVYSGTAKVEDLEAVLIRDPREMDSAWEQGRVPVMTDSRGDCIRSLKPDVVVDAIIAKVNTGTTRNMAPLTIALGPGFTAGIDVDYVIETKRGHSLGRIIREGSAIPNTGIPGNIGGYTKERVIYAPAEGILHEVCHIGDIVEKDSEIAVIDTGTETVSVKASISGVIRGMIRDGYSVTEGFKMADIDPRPGEQKNCLTISDKARCIAGGVLLAVSMKIPSDV